MYPSHKPTAPRDAHHCASHSDIQSGNRLLFGIIATLTVMLLEVFGGIYSGSLALLSDAAHMVTDLLSLSLSYLAYLLASKPADFQKTYGYYRAEVLVAFVNGLLLLVAAGFIFYEAIQRFATPHLIRVDLMLGIAAVGLIANLSTAFLLSAVKDHNLNLRGAFLHVFSDAVSSCLIVGSAVVLKFFPLYWLDPLLSILLSGVIAFWSLRLISDSVHVLMESTPKHIQIEELIQGVRQAVPEVLDMHDVHVWEITQKMYSLTAHVQVQNCSLSETAVLSERINQFLSERYHIEHANLQYEC